MGAGVTAGRRDAASPQLHCGHHWEAPPTAHGLQGLPRPGPALGASPPSTNTKHESNTGPSGHTGPQGGPGHSSGSRQSTAGRGSRCRLGPSSRPPSTFPPSSPPLPPPLSCSPGWGQLLSCCPDTVHLRAAARAHPPVSCMEAPPPSPELPAGPARPPSQVGLGPPQCSARAAPHAPRSFFQDLMSDLASAMTSSSELCFRRALTDMPTRVDCEASVRAGAAARPPHRPQGSHGAGARGQQREGALFLGATAPSGTWGPQWPGTG